MGLYYTIVWRLLYTITRIPIKQPLYWKVKRLVFRGSDVERIIWYSVVPMFFGTWVLCLTYVSAIWLAPKFLFSLISFVFSFSFSFFFLFSFSSSCDVNMNVLLWLWLSLFLSLSLILLFSCFPRKVKKLFQTMDSSGDGTINKEAGISGRWQSQSRWFSDQSSITSWNLFVLYFCASTLQKGVSLNGGTPKTPQNDNLL